MDAATKFKVDQRYITLLLDTIGDAVDHIEDLLDRVDKEKSPAYADSRKKTKVLRMQVDTLHETVINNNISAEAIYNRLESWKKTILKESGDIFLTIRKPSELTSAFQPFEAYMQASINGVIRGPGFSKKARESYEETARLKRKEILESSSN